MKKILAFLLVAIMVVALVACNGNSGTTTTATDKVETTEVTTVETTAAQTTEKTTTEVTTTAEVTTATEKVTTEETTTAEVTTATEKVTTEETTTEETTTAVVIDPNDPSAILTAAYALADGEALTGEFTLEGVVTKVGTAYSEQYKNVTFTIVVEGEEARPIDAYRAKGEGADTVKVGDTVKVTGKIKNYKGTIEFDSGCTMVITKVAQEEPQELTGIICDIDFKGGKIVDSKGLLTFPTAANEYVDNYSVYVDGTKYKVPAFVVFETGTAAIGTINSVKTATDYLNLFNKDFSMEVYYFNNNTSGGDSIQAIFCSTETGGFGIAENAGKPYFTILLGKTPYTSVSATTTSSNTELTHVVATFSKSEGVMRIYVNGAFEAETKFDSSLNVVPPNTENTMKSMIVGADIDGDKNMNHEHNGEYLEFRTADFQLLDAKIYDHALTAEEVATAFQLDQKAVTG
ncbi:MAG: LamG domain-containing protein [Clostridiales bacterium]|nr:LamG domain-containing protein [Clostridiales bacterium]